MFIFLMLQLVKMELILIDFIPQNSLATIAPDFIDTTIIYYWFYMNNNLNQQVTVN